MSSDQDPPKRTPVATDANGPGETENAEDGAAKKRKLTPEEQMALYEESLKEEDWGHQPC
jgi:hypothetical protein